jgi:hypothetical protein
MKQLLIKAKNWLKGRYYEVALTIVCLLMAVEILGTWAGFAAVFVSFVVWGFKKVN